MNRGISAARLVAASALAGALLAAGFGPAFSADRPPPQDTRTNDPSKVQSGTYVNDPNHGRIVWTILHNGYSHFSAILPVSEITLTLDAANVANSKLTAVVHMDAVTSGVPEEHFQPLLKSEEMLSTDKYPTATFTSTKIERTAPDKATITGDLTFRGVTKPEVLEATFIQAGTGPNPGYRIGFDGRMVLKRSDFEITRFLPNVGDDVTLTIEAEFITPKPPG